MSMNLASFSNNTTNPFQQVTSSRLWKNESLIFSNLSSFERSNFEFETLSYNSINNLTHFNNDNIAFIPQTAAVFATVAAILISLCGIFGNFLTILALIRYSGRDIRRRLTPSASATTNFVVALAATDLFFCSAVLPFNAGRFWTRSWPFGHFACRLYPLIYYGTVASSLMLITAITINRLILIAYHDVYRKIYSRFNVVTMIAFCWIFSYGIMAIPFFQIYGKTGLKAQTYSCTVLRDSKNRSPKKFLFAFGFLLPAIVIILCYSVILIHVRAQTAKTLIGQKTRASKRDLRLTGLICVVFGAFLTCFFPLFLGNVFIREDRYPYLHIAASICAWLNSCINPFIYFAMNARYRLALKRLFGCFECSNRHSSNQPSISLSAFGTKAYSGGGGGGSLNIVSLKNSRKFSFVTMSNNNHNKQDSVKYSSSTHYRPSFEGFTYK